MKKIILKYLSVFLFFFFSFQSAFAIFGLEKVKKGLIGDNNIVSPEKGIMDMVSYFLTFLYLIAFIYIVWSGFQIMTATGDEEKVKSAKQRIIYTFVGILVIFTASQITFFILDGLDSVNK